MCLAGTISEQAKERAKQKILKAGRGNMLDELSGQKKNYATRLRNEND